MSFTKDVIETEFRTSQANKVSQDIDKIQGSIKELNSENERLLIIKKKLESARTKDTAAIANVNKQLKANNIAIKQQTTQLKKVNSQLKINEMTGKQLRTLNSQLRKELIGVSKALQPQKWNQLNNELIKVQKQQAKVRAGTKQTSAVMKTLKSALPLLGVGFLTQQLFSLTKEFLNLTKQIQGEAIRAAVVFGDELEYVEEQAADLAKQMGVTNREFVTMAATTADLLIPLNFTRKEAANMSVELQSLTGALDEWTAGSVGAKEISNILTKAMLGENEQLKQLGIAIRKDSEEFRTLVKQTLAAKDVTKAQAEAIATLELIQRKSTDAQTAYNKEGNKLLRLQKEIGRVIRQKKEDFVNLFNEEKKQVDLYNLENKELNANFNALKDTNLSTDARKELISQINTQYGTYLPNLLTEKSSLEEIEKAQKAVNDQMRIDIISKALKEELTNALKEEAKAVESIVKGDIAAAKAKTQLTNVTDEASKIQLEQTIKYAEIGKALTQSIIDNSSNTEKNIKEKFKRIAEYYDIAFESIERAVKGTEEVGSIIPKVDEKQVKKINDLYAALEKLTTDFLNSQLSANEKEIATAAEKYKTLIDQAGKDQALINQIVLQRDKELQAIRQKQFEKEQEDKLKKEKEFQERRAQLLAEYQLLSGEELMQMELDQLAEFHEQKLLSETEYLEAKKEIEDWYREQDAQKLIEHEQAVNAARDQYGLIPRREQTRIELEEIKKKNDAGLLDEKDTQAAITTVKLDAARKNLADINALIQLGAEYVQQIRETELLEVQNATDQRIEAAERQAREEGWSEEKLAKRKKIILSESEKEQLAIRKKYADIEFGIKLAQTIAAGALAVVQALAQLGPIAGAVAAILIGTTTGVQVASLINERNKVKQLNKGKYTVTGSEDGKTYSNIPYFGPASSTGVYNGGKPTLINETGGEIVIAAKHVDNLKMNYPAIIDAIYNTRPSVSQMQDGNVDSVSNISGTGQQQNNAEIANKTLTAIAVSLNRLNTILDNGIESYMLWENYKTDKATFESVENNNSLQ